MIINQIAQGGGSAGFVIKKDLSAAGNLTISTELPDFSQVKSVGNYALYYAFVDCQATEMPDFSNIETLGDSAMSGSFQRSAITGVINLGKITTVEKSLGNAFMDCPNITGLIFSKKGASINNQVLGSAFVRTTGLKTAVFRMTSISSSSISFASDAFNNSGIEKAHFNNLNYAVLNGLGRVFYSTPYLTDVYFYKFAIDASPNKGCFGSIVYQQMFNGKTEPVNIHFPIASQAFVESMTYYADKWGATNGTILFDLVTSLAGADSNTYVREQDESTSTANAWLYNSTLYYTSGTTEPQVGDTIYSDSACTTAVTTISAIA